MAKTISQLPDATSVADGDELIVQQSGVTKRASKLEVIAGIKDASIASDAAIAGSKLQDGSVTPVKLAQPLTLSTAQATTSGTNIDFTGIPSWVKRITMMFSGVSTNGTSGLSIQLGTSGGIKNSEYTGGVTVDNSYNSNSSAFFVHNGTPDVISGVVVLALLGSNVWTEFGNLPNAAGAVRVSGGAVSLAGTLTTVRLIAANGTDAFDAGSVNIMYEG